MNHLDPSWLHSFVEIAGTGSVSRAAQRVHRTASAVSLHLRQLESALGARLVERLVERTTRALRLSAEGERFLPFAQGLLDMQAQARQALAQAPSPEVWRIGVSEYFMPHRFGELLALLQQQAQGARLELLWAASADLLQLWAAGDIDLAVVTARQPPEGAKLLRRESLAWVAARGGVPSGQQPTPLVMLGPDCPVRQMALDALARSGQPHVLRLSCTGSQAAVSAIRAGWGVGCLNQSAIPQDLALLSHLDAKRWASPGRIAFYLLAKPDRRGLAKALAAWSA